GRGHGGERDVAADGRRGRRVGQNGVGAGRIIERADQVRGGRARRHVNRGRACLSDAVDADTFGVEVEAWDGRDGYAAAYGYRVVGHNARLAERPRDTRNDAVKSAVRGRGRVHFVDRAAGRPDDCERGH